MCFAFLCFLCMVLHERKTVRTESTRKTPRAQSVERRSDSSEKNVVMPAATKKESNTQVPFLFSLEQEMTNETAVQRKSTAIFKNVIMDKNLKTVGVFVYLWHTGYDYTFLLHKSQYPFLAFMPKNPFISLNSASITKKTHSRWQTFHKTSHFDRIKPLLLQNNMLK